MSQLAWSGADLQAKYHQAWFKLSFYQAFSIAAKHSMLIGFPFIILYLWSHNGVKKEFQRFLIYFFITIILVEMPLFLSEGFRLMVLENREVDKIYWLYLLGIVTIFTKVNLSILCELP